MGKRLINLASHLLVDDDTGRIVGIKHPDGTEENLVLFNPSALSAPVDGVRATLTSDMTNANADIALTAVQYGSNGNTISIVYVDPAANSQSLGIRVNGRAIRVLLATNSGGTITSTANQVVAAIAAHADAAALVTAAAEGTGLGVVNAKTVASLTGGINGTPGVAGSSLLMTANGQLYAKTSAQTWARQGKVAGTNGGLTRKVAEATATLSGASTTISVGVPSGAILLGAQLIVETLITSAAATSWAAAFSGGATTSLASGQAFTKNTKVDKPLVPAVATNTTQVAITPNTGTFTAGKIRALVYYDEFTTLTSV